MLVKDVEINVNWLLNQALGAGKTNYQITKISNDQVLIFLNFLKDNPFLMPDGTEAIYWVQSRISLRYDQCQNKMSQEWEKVRQRYRYILHQISLILMKYKGIQKKEAKENKNELSVSFND